VSDTMKALVAWVGVISTLTLSQWAAVVGIVAGLLTIVYTALLIITTYRDKAVRHTEGDLNG